MYRGLADYVIVGRFEDDVGMETAYKVYDIKNNSCGMLYASTVRELVKRGQQVVGFELSCNSKGPYVAFTKYIFKLKEVDLVDENGTPIKDTGKEVVICCNGLGKLRTFGLVNSKGEFRRVELRDFIELTRSGKIIGARVDGENDKVRLHKKCILIAEREQVS